MAVFPIWKDKSVSVGDPDQQAVPFRIKDNTSIIYSGTAYLRPGQSHAAILANEICADFLRSPFPSLGSRDDTPLCVPSSFTIEAMEEGGDWASESVQFLPDWSYDPSYDVSSMGLAFPINGHIDARQVIPYSHAEDEGENVAFTLYYDNGTDEDHTAWFEYGYGTVAIDPSSEDGGITGLTKVVIGSKVYQVVTDCAEWVLYYKNAVGGWDSFLIEGLVTERTEVLRHETKTEYNNSDPLARGRRNFANELTKVYTFNTSWLNDNESERMHHLLNSTDVYMCNLASRDTFGVVLNNTETAVKTYKGNGARLVNYTFEATVSQDRMRR